MLEPILQAQHKKPFYKPQLCQNIFNHKHETCIFVGLRVKGSRVPIESLATIFFHWQCDFTSTFKGARSHFVHMY